MKQLQEEIRSELADTEAEKREYLLSFEARAKPAQEVYLASTKKASAGYTRDSAAALEKPYCAKQSLAEALLENDSTKIARWENNLTAAAEFLQEEHDKAKRTTKKAFEVARQRASASYLQIPLDLVVKHSHSSAPERVNKLLAKAHEFQQGANGQIAAYERAELSRDQI
eukprot:SAG11_NODE_2437_length_3364_cov_10.869525_2_plen_170_part_00